MVPLQVAHVACVSRTGRHARWRVVAPQKSFQQWPRDSPITRRVLVLLSPLRAKHPAEIVRVRRGALAGQRQPCQLLPRDDQARRMCTTNGPSVTVLGVPSRAPWQTHAFRHWG